MSGKAIRPGTGVWSGIEIAVKGSIRVVEVICGHA